jgi:hypothetical protein
MIVAGCAPGANGDLRSVVEEASLPGISESACEWGSSSFDADPKSWYGCWADVPWTVKRTTRTVRARLVARGYRVESARGPGATYFTAVRGAHTLCVDVLGPRWARARNTYVEQVVVAAGHAFVDVWAVDGRPGQKRCPFLPDGAEE